MFCTLSDKVTSVKPSHPSNALVPMVVKRLDILISVKAIQFWNALLPIEVTKADKYTFSSVLLFLKASLPIVLTGYPPSSSGIKILVAVPV